MNKLNNAGNALSKRGILPDTGTTMLKLSPLLTLILSISGRHLLAQAPAAPPSVSSKILIQEPLEETLDPKVSVIMLPISVGLTAGPHTHKGPVFAYILEGEIENQVDPDPPKLYHPGDFFKEPAMHVHRLLRNLSKTEPAKILVFEVGDIGKAAPAVRVLMQEPADVSGCEGRLITLTIAAGATLSGSQQLAGPVFAYVAKGEVENRVDPDPPVTYGAGDLFYKSPLRAYRILNPSHSESAELVVFQIAKKGEPPAQ